MYLGSIIFPFPISSFLFTPQREKGKGESGRKRKKKFLHSKKGTREKRERNKSKISSCQSGGKTDGGPFLFCLPCLRGACFSFPHTANRMRKHSKIQLRKSRFTLKLYIQYSANGYLWTGKQRVLSPRQLAGRQNKIILSLCFKARRRFPLISNHHHMKTKTNTAAGKSISLLSPFTITSNA